MKLKAIIAFIGAVLFAGSQLIACRQVLSGGRQSISFVPCQEESETPLQTLEDFQGRWVHVGPNRTFAAAVCCGTEDDRYRMNPSQCGTEPRWMQSEDYFRGTFYRGPRTEFYQHTDGHACQCRDDYLDEYEWQAPDLPAFDPVQTCRRLQHPGKNRTVLIVGDSTFSQTAATLMNALLPGGCSHQIAFSQADTLIKQRMGALNRGLHWRQAVEKEKPDIVIMGAGAHIRTEENYKLVVEKVLEDIQEMLKDDGMSNTTYVWKTQQPGGCTDDIFHADDPIRAARDLKNASVPLGKYNHHMFYQRDLYTISKFRGLGLPYLDMRMLYSRSDAHIHSGVKETIAKYDCLHMCSPGPLDVIAPLFQRLLMQLDDGR